MLFPLSTLLDPKDAKKGKKNLSAGLERLLLPSVIFILLVYELLVMFCKR